ncbi:MAG: arylsulfatase [Clostridium sp.]|nr:arylsulfatase [Clostridium sp.]
MNNKYLSLTCISASLMSTVSAQTSPLNGDIHKSSHRPNVILLVADDLGYGDLECYGAKNIRTPHVNKLARQGIRFTNCHATAATSTPSRYGLLTGEYAWRRPDTDVAAGNAASIIHPDQYTIADLFHDAGYYTGAIGKWHLGLGEKTGEQDWNGKLTHTPRDLGFDYHYIQAATADRVPCVYLEQDTVANYDPTAPISVSYRTNFEGEPTGASNPGMLKLMYSHGHNHSIVDSISRIGFMKGGGTALWKDENIADSIVEHSIRFINDHKDEPFFLYLATNDVHVPRWPHQRFRGKNAMGLRGDAIAQFDWTVGQVMNALRKAGIEDNTLVILTSDNGPVLDDGYADQAEELVNGHSPTGGLRGFKYSGYEGGTMVPFIVRWPKGIKASKVPNGTLLSHIDLFASLGTLLSTQWPEEAAPDSRNQLNQMLGTSHEHRPWVSELSSTRVICVRNNEWKYIPANNKMTKINWGPDIETGNLPVDQLYNMLTDPAETTNLATDRPDVVERMKELHRQATAIRK